MGYQRMAGKMKLVKETIQWETQSPKRIAMKRAIKKKKMSRLGGRILVGIGCVLFIIAAIKLTVKPLVEREPPIPIPQKELDLQNTKFQSLINLQISDTTWVRLQDGSWQQGSAKKQF
jgi:hypothetical protein